MCGGFRYHGAAFIRRHQRTSLQRDIPSLEVIPRTGGLLHGGARRPRVTPLRKIGATRLGAACARKVWVCRGAKR